jgi:hypothetical protein
VLLSLALTLVINVGAAPHEVPDTRCSVRPLSKHIRSLIPGYDPTVEVDGLSTKWKMNEKRKFTDMEFIKWNVDVNTTAFKDKLLRMEDELLKTEPRKGLLDLIETKDKKKGDELRMRYLTARSDRYNIFYWDEPWVGHYYWSIKRAFHKFVKFYNIKIEKPLFAHSWANCLRKDQHLYWHNHAEPGDFSYSGTFAAHVPTGSFTLYENPNTKKVIKNNNEENDLVMFQSMIMHKTVEINDEQYEEMKKTGTDCRITSSWDISADPIGNHHSTPFYDPNDIDFSKDPDTKEMMKFGLARAEVRNEEARQDAMEGKEDDEEGDPHDDDEEEDDENAARADNRRDQNQKKIEQRKQVGNSLKKLQKLLKEGTHPKSGKKLTEKQRQKIVVMEKALKKKLSNGSHDEL